MIGFAIKTNAVSYRMDAFLVIVRSIGAKGAAKFDTMESVRGLRGGDLCEFVQGR